ncbi:MAG TPA: hypothetical protein VML75_18195 [Kofleriaceae bacterium]|nr:hypothetical protein [Kofleriaceae bacterium]
MRIVAVVVLAAVLGCGRSQGTQAVPEAAPAEVVAIAGPEPVAVVRLGEVELRLYGAAAAAAFLGQRDEFVAAMSGFDRQARVGSREPVDEAAFLAHVKAQTLEWGAAEIEAVRAAAAELGVALERQGIALPIRGAVNLVRTTGKEEIPGAAYTRGLTVVFPEGSNVSAGLLAHELFHVMTRNDAALRDRLYAAIGFRPNARVELGGELAALRITNPDAPRVDHAIEVRVDGSPRKATPVIYASRAYDGGTVFDYLQVKLALLDDRGTLTDPVDLRDFGAVEGFFEQVGRNTSYIIHPEEILAENFRLLATASAEVKTPEILEGVRGALRAR